MTSINRNSRDKTKRMVLLSMLVALIILLGLTPLGLIPLGFINVTILCVPVIVGTLYTDWKGGLALGFSFGAVSFYSAIVKPSALVSTLMAASPVLTAIMTFIPRLCIPLVAWFVYNRLRSKNENESTDNAALVFGTLISTLLGLVVVLVLYLSGALKLPKDDETFGFLWSRNQVLLLMGCMVLLSAIIGVVTASFLGSKTFRDVIAKHAPEAVAAVCGSLTNTILYLGMMLLFYVICGIDTTSVLALIGGTALIAGLSEAAVAAILIPPILTAVQKIRTR